MENTVAFSWGRIGVTLDHSLRFRVGELEKSFDTAQQAKDAIDRMQKEKKEVTEKLDLKCLSGLGEPVTITGIHAGTGKKLTRPPLEKYGDYQQRDLYPDHPKVRAVLAQQRDLQVQLDSLDSTLKVWKLAEDPFTNKKPLLKDRYEFVSADYARKLNKIDESE